MFEVHLRRSFSSGHITNNQAQKAIDLFREVKDPDAILLNLLFNACAHLGTTEELNLAKKIYQKLPKTVHSNTYLLTSLLDVYMKCGDVSSAQQLFNKSTKKELSMYGAMMKGSTSF